MKLLATTILAPAKITHYLLKKLQVDDKSGYLLLAGYTRAHAERLEHDMRNQLHPAGCGADVSETTITHFAGGRV